MHLQSQNVLGQAGLLIGPENMLRVSPPVEDVPIQLDDWQCASTELPEAAELTYQEYKDCLQHNFFTIPAGLPIFYN